MAESDIILTLDPTASAAPAPARPEPAPVAEETVLTPEEQKMVDAFAEKIDLSDSAVVLNYGAASQQKIADFSDATLSSVRTKDLGAVGDMISDLMLELKGFTAEEEKKGWFRKSVDRLTLMKTRYDKAEVNVEKIAGMLEGHQVQLLKDITLLDKLYERNLTNFKELSMYILAGKKCLEQARTVELERLKKQALESGKPEDAQKASDYANLINRFEKKVHDLELTRTVAIQMAPQIRLIQNNDAAMAEKIQSTIVNTIPLWKSQMVLTLGLYHSQQAMEAQRAVTDMTNELLRKNADMLKLGTIETQRETERGVVDIETLQYTNQSLISTLDEVLTIQQQGREKRAAAELELRRIENELKNKLLEMKG